VLAAAPMAAACTTELQVAPLASGASPPTGSFVYALPREYFAVSAVVTLTGCDAIPVDAKGDDIPVTPVPDGQTPPTIAGYRPALNVTETITVTPVVEADGTAQFAVPYEKLRTWRKETSFTVTSNANKSIASVNGTINDQLGPVALQSIYAAVRIAGGFAVPGVSAVQAAQAAPGHGLTFEGHKKQQQPPQQPPAPPQPPAFCSTTVTNALKDIDFTNQAIYKQASADATAKVTSPEIAKLQARLARLQSDAKLSQQYGVVLQPDVSFDAVSQTVSTSLPLYEAAISGWLSDDGRSWFADGAHQGKPGHDAVTAPAQIQIALKSWTLGAISTVSNAHAAIAPTNPAGLVLRDPALGTLRICRNACSTSGISNDLAPPVPVSVPQLGRYLVLPLKNDLFENSSLNVTVAADGTVTSMGNHSTGTLGSSLDTAGKIGDALASQATARNGAIAAQNTAAVNSAQFADNVNKALADCLSQQEAVRKAGGTPVGACQ
jgi:hypothetical protein